MKKALFSILPLLCAAAFAVGPGCSGDSAREKAADVPWNIPDECLDQVEDWLPAAAADDDVGLSIAASLEAFTAELSGIIGLPGIGYADKIRMLRAEALPGSVRLLGDLERIRDVAMRSDANPWTEGHGRAAAMILTFMGRLDALLRDAHQPAVSVPAGREGAHEDFVMDLDDALLDRYWMYYHWAEVLAGYYDDSGHTHVFEDFGRTSFIDEEVGEAGVEMMMDYWRVPEAVWNDTSLTDNERLMHVKYTMWDNPHWGNQEYVGTYWQYEPAFVDEDCALFTGNVLGALAFEYGLTRLPRTLARMQAMMRAYRLFDRFTLDTDHPLDQEDYDGRIQRGTKTKNLYHADEIYLMTIESWDPLEFSHNNSWQDRLTGRERKNVSRDQYYGLILGYYATFKVFSAITDRTDAEEALFCNVIIHMNMILEYLFSDRLRPGWGILYNLYSLFEGSCANPPNLTFMSFWAYPGYEEMTGLDYSARFGFGNRLIHALFALGRIVGGVELSQQLFRDAQSGLTALNQYMITLYMSDLSPEEWQFIYPPEVLVEHPERRTLWRRVIALFFSKYGCFGNDVFREVIEEMLCAENNPAPSLDDLSWNVQHGHAHVEPATKVEDLLLPLAVTASGAVNRDEVADAFRARYQELLDDGSIGFAGTDLPYR